MGGVIELTIAQHTSVIRIAASLGDCMLAMRHLSGYVATLVVRSVYAIAQDDQLPDESMPDLLPFDKGDFIRVVQHNLGNDWEFGCVNGHYGNFPLRLVQHTTRTPAMTEGDNPVPLDPGSMSHISTEVVTDHFSVHADVLPLVVAYAQLYFRT